VISSTQLSFLKTRKKVIVTNGSNFFLAYIGVLGYLRALALSTLALLERAAQELSICGARH
jgi:hypothetical protein